MVVSKTGKFTGSSEFLSYRDLSLPEISPKMAQSVSQFRKDLLQNEVNSGIFKGDTGNNLKLSGNPDIATVAGNVKSLRKRASAATSGSGGNWRGGNDTMRQSPDIYSPLWLNSNLNLPRDRGTLNAWSRAFYALNGIVQNAISLHSTYPISKLSIKCKNPKVEKFFADMIEEIDLMNVCVQIAQEYWILGEAFVYAELDEDNRKWSRLFLQNPDYISVQKSVVADEPIISIKPDATLKRICTSNRPSDIQQRERLNKNVIEHVRKGENIPLNNFYVSHLARKVNPYDTRGTGLIVSSFRQLMLMDKLRECYSSDTEVLTSEGFRNIWDLVEITDSLDINPNHVVGTEPSEDGTLGKLITLKKGVKIACVNPETNQIEYHEPEEFIMSQYVGKMLHFNGKKIDSLVTPNHKMWAKEQTNGKWSDYKKIKAGELLEKNKYYKFKCNTNWIGKEINSVDVLGFNIPINTYLTFLGYLVSEGCIYQNYENGRYDSLISMNQLTSSDCYEDMVDSFSKIAAHVEKKLNSKISLKGSGYSKDTPKEMWEARIHGKDIAEFFLKEIGNGASALSGEKHLPRWIFDLSPNLLKIVLKAMVSGDGSEKISKYGTGSKSFDYSTISKQLANDVYEIVFKLGYAPNMCEITSEKSDGRTVTEYRVLWSNTEYGNEPLVYTGIKPDCKSGGGAVVDEIDYDGQVWCFQVPTGLFVTRRNNKISIHGNSKFAQADNMINPLTLVKIGGDTFQPSPTDLDQWRQVFEEAQNDKDFKIFTHEKVTVEKVGSQGGILDTQNDITQLIKEIYTGLQVPSVLMDGGADTTYANGGVALDVLRQRYMQFRNMLTIWLRRKIFAPISKINDFYDYVKDGNKTKKVLIVPDVEWNHMSLFDAGDYIQTLVGLVTSGEDKHVSLQTLYRSLGLVWDDEVNKMRAENIQDAIFAKEKEALGQMSLNELRAIGPSDEIQEIAQSPLPGEQSTPSGEPAGDDMDLPGMEPSGGAPPPPPPPPPG